MDLRQIANRKGDVYGISLITLRVTNNLLAQRWPIMLSKRTEYTELESC
jgi:hypothetical protein